MFKVIFQFIKLSVFYGGFCGAATGLFFAIWGGLPMFIGFTLLGMLTFGPIMAYQTIGDVRKTQRERESLTCASCGALAEPIDGTRDRYKCNKCGVQFAGAKHSL